MHRSRVVSGLAGIGAGVLLAGLVPLYFLYGADSAPLLPIADGGEESAGWQTGAGAGCDTTACYEAVDDTSGEFCSGSDGDGSYIAASTEGAVQTFDIDESSIPDGSTITNIAITACHGKGAGAPGSFQTRYCHSGSCANSGASVTGGGVYAEATQNYSTNIIKTAGSDLEIGVVQTSPGRSVRISRLSAVVTYTPPATGDTIAPAAIADLSSSATTQSSITLSWTAPGDDGTTGTAASYDVRYSTSAINEENFSSVNTATGEPSPSVAGSSESFEVTGLSAGTTYFFAIKTSDEAANTSAISNVHTAATGEGSSINIPTGGTGGVQASAIRISGFTAPGNTLSLTTKSLLDDAFINVPLTQSWVKEDGSFFIEALGLLGGEYFVALQVTDPEGQTGRIVSFNVNLLIEDLEVEDLVVPPTLTIERTRVSSSETVYSSGYAKPDSTVELHIDGKRAGSVGTDSMGLFSFPLPIDTLDQGVHYIKARVMEDDAPHSDFSENLAIKVSALEYPRADLNEDEVVDVTDWSIFLSRWENREKQLSIDFNNDGKLTVSDLSIFLRAMRGTR